MAKHSRKCNCANCIESIRNTQGVNPLKLTGWTLGLMAVSYTLFGEKGVLLATALATYVCYVVEAKQ